MPTNFIYKYVTADRIDVLKDNRIRFTQPAALNDPFDAMPNLTLAKAKLLSDMVSNAKNDYGVVPDSQSNMVWETLIDSTFDQWSPIMSKIFAFLSVSKIPDNLLMWSQYANSHTGFAIGFDADREFFAAGRLSRLGLREVTYSRDRWILPADGFTGLDDGKMAEAMDGFFFTKSIDWEYEQEYRIVAHQAGNDPHYTQGN
jgi:hypothetical protein